MNKQIRDIKNSVRQLIDKAYYEGICLIDEKSKEINILDITNDCIKDINEIRNVLEVLNQSVLKLQEETYDKTDNRNLITLDDDFTGVKVVRIIIDGYTEVQVKNSTDAIVKFCEIILIKDRQKFVDVVSKMPKNFSKNKEDLNDAKSINGCDYFIGTKANSTTLFRMIKRIAKDFGINPSLIKVEIK